MEFFCWYISILQADIIQHILDSFLILGTSISGTWPVEWLEGEGGTPRFGEEGGTLWLEVGGGTPWLGEEGGTLWLEGGGGTP